MSAMNRIWMRQKVAWQMHLNAKDIHFRVKFEHFFNLHRAVKVLRQAA